MVVFDPIANKVDSQMTQPIRKPITPQDDDDFLPSSKIAIVTRQGHELHGMRFDGWKRCKGLLPVVNSRDVRSKDWIGAEPSFHAGCALESKKKIWNLKRRS